MHNQIQSLLKQNRNKIVYLHSGENDQVYISRIHAFCIDTLQDWIHRVRCGTPQKESFSLLRFSLQKE